MDHGRRRSTPPNSTILFQEHLPGIPWYAYAVLAVLFVAPAISISVLPRLGYHVATSGVVFGLTMAGIIVVVNLLWWSGRVVEQTTTVTPDSLSVRSGVGPISNESRHHLSTVAEIDRVTKFRQEYVRLRNTSDSALGEDWHFAGVYLHTRRPDELIAAIERATAELPEQVLESLPSMELTDVVYEEHVVVPHPYRGLLYPLFMVALNLYNLIMFILRGGSVENTVYVFGDGPNTLDTLVGWGVPLMILPIGVWGVWRLWSFSKSKTVRVTGEGVHYRYARNHWRFYSIERISGILASNNQVTIHRHRWIPASISSSSPDDLVAAIERVKGSARTRNEPPADSGHERARGHPSSG